MMMWWYVTAAGRYIGKVLATYEDVSRAVGPYHVREGNHIIVYGPNLAK